MLHRPFSGRETCTRELHLACQTAELIFSASPSSVGGPSLQNENVQVVLTSFGAQISESVNQIRYPFSRDATALHTRDAGVDGALQRGRSRRHAARAAAHRLQGRPRMEGCASPPQTREPPADAERSALPSVWLRSDGCTLWEAGCGVRLRLSVGIVPRGTRPSRTPAWRHAALAASRVQRALPVADRVV